MELVRTEAETPIYPLIHQYIAEARKPRMVQGIRAP